MMGMEPMGADPDLEAFARKNGFQSYAQMKAFMARRSESLQDSHTTARAQPTPPPAPPRPPQQQPNEGIFGYIIRKMSGG